MTWGQGGPKIAIFFGDVLFERPLNVTEVEFPHKAMVTIFLPKYIMKKVV